MGWNVGRFDYVKYDDKATAQQNGFKAACVQLEGQINKIGSTLDPLVDKAFCSRAKDKALSKLEEVYMWIGKAVRDEQVARNLSAPPLQEERKDG